MAIVNLATEPGLGSGATFWDYGQERNGVGADGFAAADGAQTLAGLGFDAHLAWLDAESGCRPLNHAGNVRREFGALEADGGINVEDGITRFIEQVAHAAKEQQAGSLVPLGGSVREVPANVTQPCRSQQRIAYGMGQRVAIRVPHRTFLERDPHPAEDKLASRCEEVNIIPDSYAEGIANSEW